MRFTIKKITLIISLTALFLSGVFIAPSPAFAGNTGDGDYIKVGLKYGSSAVSSTVLSCDSGLSLGTLDSGAYVELLPLSGYTQVTVAAENGKVTVKSGDILLSGDIGTNGCIMPYGDGDMIKIDGVSYRDGAFFLVNSNGSVNVINYIGLDNYVKGVLNAEMNHGHPLEALKAQAVAARSYGAYNYNRHGDLGFDVCSSTHCQMYKGYADEYPETNKAVDETAGLEIYHSGQSVIGYYSKNSGGYTQDVKDVWNSSLGYLKAVKDEYCPLYPWEASFTFDQLESKLSAANYNVGTISSVEITKRNQSGAVDTLTFTGSAGTAKVEKEKIRTVFGAAIMKSTMFSFTDVFKTGSATGTGTPPASGDILKKIVVTNGVSSEGGASTLYIIGADKAVKAVEAGKLSITDGTRLSALSKTTTGTVTADKGNIPQTEIIYTDPVVFLGAGYGHGIGMPQDSAIEMAKKGFTFDKILQYYYTGVEIK